MLKTKPRLVFVLPFWVLRGRAFTKAKIAAHVHLNAAALPYRQEVLEYVRECQQKGAKTILASASNQNVVQEVANHCACFHATQGSSDSVNLKSERKLKWITEHVSETFEYIGDSKSDLPIWQKASRAILVNPDKSVLSRVKTFGIDYTVIHDAHPIGNLIIKQMRVHQWVKNLLLAVPIIAAHKTHSLDAVLKVVVGILSFSMIASMVYIVNDLLDIEHDRHHPTKKRRPFASGNLPIKVGFFIAPALAITGLSLALLLGVPFVGVLALYVLTNLLYSTKLKEIIMLDVVILASFYTMRLLAGSVAANIPISHWLLSFSTFFFLGLAMVKRYTELLRVADDAQTPVLGRGYNNRDKQPVLVMGICASMISILVLALYFSSSDTLALYAHPNRLWLMAPLMLFWSGRVWLMTHRGEIDDDPVVFAVKDVTSWVVLLCATLITVAAA